MHLLVYQPESYRHPLEWNYLHCGRILSKKSLIQILDEVTANQEFSNFIENV